MNRAGNLSTSAEMNITIWGPPQSGKQWMLWSFVRELELINQIYPDFRCEIFETYPGDDQLTPVRADPPLKPSVGKWRDFMWFFRRRPLKDDQAHHVSTFVHNMHISIVPGEEGIKSFFNLTEHEAVRSALARSRFVIAILDPTRLSSTGNKNGVEIDAIAMKKTTWNQEEYLKVVERLLETLATVRIQNRHVAFCISKMDQIAIREMDWLLLERLFGEQMVNLLKYYQSQFAIDVFAFSSFGGQLKEYLSDDAFDGNNWTVWNPINAVAPFFHFFQEIERTAIRQQSPFNVSNFIFNRQKMYVPYPKTNWTSTFAKENI